MAEHVDVMISSTARDLPDHREKVMHACLRQSMHPIMMEHLPTDDADAIAAYLKMVNDADLLKRLLLCVSPYVSIGSC
jgi:hypothetical protein